MRDFIEAVIQSNKEIATLIKSSSHEVLAKSHQKGEGGDVSLTIDIEAEKIFIKNLSLYGQIYSEECGYRGKAQQNIIVVDPIDGSDNFISNMPYFGTSIALKRNDTTLCGVVTNLANGDIFIKTQDEFKRGSLFSNKFKKIMHNSCSKVGIFERSYAETYYHEKLLKNSIKYRSLGALALSLAYAHEVNFVMFHGKIREFDVAAGLFMCEDLWIKKDENFLFVSKDKQIFDKMLEGILNNKNR